MLQALEILESLEGSLGSSPGSGSPLLDGPLFVEEDDNDEEDELSLSPPEGLLAFNDLVISLRMFSLMDILKFCKSNSLSLVLSKLFSFLVEGVGGDECLYSASSGFG